MITVRVHYLKIDPHLFPAVQSGDKPFEIRRHDRDFQRGDMLVLQPFDRPTNSYQDGVANRRVTYVLTGGQYGLEAGYCCLGLDLGDEPVPDCAA